MSNSTQKNRSLLLIIEFICSVLFISFGNISPQAHSLILQNSQSNTATRVYVFFDQIHSFVQNKNAFVPANSITVDFNFAKDTSINIFGSNQFCKNIFYFSENKIIFYNPSREMNSAAWCQVELIDKKTQKFANYKFVLNKTFSSWCQEKDINSSIGKTVKAILNIFGSQACSDSMHPILAGTRVLNLSNSNLDDISPIADFLQIKSLWLDNNSIENVEALGAMRNIIFLSLNNNFISNTNSLIELKKLQWLFLNNNQIINIDFVYGLKNLKFLGINGNLIEDPTPLYSISPSTYILANGNPFMKDLCKYHRESQQNNKNSYFLKNCPENYTIKSNNGDIELLSDPSRPHEQKRILNINPSHT